MLSIYLAFVLSSSGVNSSGVRSSRRPVSVSEDPSEFICDTSLGDSLCTKTGMGVYATYDNPPTRPTTFYPISHTQWSFTVNSNVKYLGISYQEVPNVSGKFSGVFTAPATGLFIFQLVTSHVINGNVCYFSTTENPSFIEADVSYSGVGTAYSLSCSTRTSSSCANYLVQTDYWYCERQYYLESGQKYPLFAGTRYNWTIPSSDPLWMRLLYRYPSGRTVRIGKEAVVGLSGYAGYVSRSPSPTVSSSPGVSPSPSASRSQSSSRSPTEVYTDDDSYDSNATTVSDSKKKTAILIGGTCAGLVAAAVLVVVTVWFIVKRVRDSEDRRKSSSHEQRISSSGSVMSRTDSTFKYGGDIRRRSSTDSRRGGRASNLVAGTETSVTQGSVTNAVERYMGTGQSGSSKKRHSGSGKKRHSSSGKRSHSGSGKKRRSGSGKRSHSGSGKKRRSSSGKKSHSGSGKKRRSSSGKKSHSGSGKKRRSSSGKGGRPSHRSSGLGSRRGTGQSGSGKKRRSGSGKGGRSSHRSSGLGNRRGGAHKVRPITGQPGPANNALGGRPAKQ